MKASEHFLCPVGAQQCCRVLPQTATSQDTMLPLQIVSSFCRGLTGMLPSLLAPCVYERAPVVLNKALAKRMQHVGATSCNILVRNMLRSFWPTLLNMLQHDSTMLLATVSSVWPWLTHRPSLAGTSLFSVFFSELLLSSFY